MPDARARARARDLPPGVAPYRTIGPFDEATLPKGLLASHSLAEGVWGLLRLERGRIDFVWEDAAGGVAELVAPAEIVVPPTVLHHLEKRGDFRLAITFHKEG